jgi:hypothetical protein
MKQYILEARGMFEGTFGDWRPAIQGLMGISDLEASTFDTAEEAHDAVELMLERGVQKNDIRIMTQFNGGANG